MRPEDWQAGMRHEADAAPDEQWASETRRAAWWRDRQLDARRMMTWRPLATLLLAAVAPMTMLLVVQPGVAYTGYLAYLLFQFLMLLSHPVTATLLLLSWIAVMVLRGQAVWTSALAATLTMPLSFLVVIAVLHGKGGAVTWHATPILLTFLWKAALFFALAWMLGRARRVIART